VSAANGSAGQGTVGAANGSAGQRTVSAAGGSGTEPADPPFLRVLRGDASPGELAALVVVLSSVRAGAEPEPDALPLWGGPPLRAGLQPGRGAWRASALPR
jgi:hypothetical protein